MTAASYNELTGIGSHSGNYSGMSRELWYPLMDNAANTTVVDRSGRGRDGTASANTSGLSTTGPNSWLTSSLAFNDTNVKIDSPFTGSLGDFSCLTRFNAPALTGPHFDRIVDKSYINGFWMGRNGSGYDTDWGGGIKQTSGAAGTYTTLSINAWHSLAMSRNGTTQSIYADGSYATGATVDGTGTGTDVFAIGYSTATSGSPNDYFNGKISEVALFSRALSSGEVSDWHAGPEPVNTAAPSLSGIQTEGQVLTCSSGTWGLASPFSGGSNGTITYSYQWTRSNDSSGSSEANIGGATSSTYTLQAGDVGKYIRCRVRASNDGGYDSAADTNSGFTSAIASAARSVGRVSQLTGGGIPGQLYTSFSGRGGFTVTASLTQDDQTVSAAIDHPVTLTGSLTQDDQTVSATISHPVVASASLTQADQTLSATISNPVTLAANVTQDDQTVSAAISHPDVITASLTQDDQTLSATIGRYSFIDASLTQDDQTASATISHPVVASASLTQDNQTLAAAIVNPVVLAASVTQDGQTVAATINPIIGISASLNQADNTISAAAVALIGVAIDITQDDQALTSHVRVGGALGDSNMCESRMFKTRVREWL